MITKFDCILYIHPTLIGIRVSDARNGIFSLKGMLWTLTRKEDVLQPSRYSNPVKRILQILKEVELRCLVSESKTFTCGQVAVFGLTTLLDLI